MIVLVLNAGSSSLKYQLINNDTGDKLAQGVVERIADDGFEQAVSDVLAALPAGTDIEAVGHRVVHGGDAFRDAAIIDDDVTAAIEACIPLAPLHNPKNLAGIAAARKALPDVDHVAVFDTAFHATLPRRARAYAIDTELADKHHVRRFGFHGTSHAYVAERAARAMKRPLNRLRLITCHLGNGASVCAVECGRSVETSMGMTPLEGLVMGTRAGDIDAGALLHLMRAEGLTADDADTLLNKKSGLLGLSGVSRDLRDVERAAAEGNDRARVAVNVFAHRVRKYIGAYAAAMGGVDAVIMTGGIGENARAMRHRILQRLEFLGLVIDEDKNADADVNGANDAVALHADGSTAQAWVIATDEERRIAEESAHCIERSRQSISAAPIPIAISARHVHLTAEVFAELFGDGNALTAYKPLSQPGQFAANEKVNIIGPKNRIDGVRILGPFRPKCQVEVSRTDEFHLGVDAPVRHSGHVQNSAPIIVEGPKGRVRLDEGLICAWRHIHMTPDDAEAYGVQDRDVVEVAITGGDRDLTFGDVVVRVSAKYATEMHVDTDEANAAELPRDAKGMLVTVEGRQAALKKRA